MFDNYHNIFAITQHVNCICIYYNTIKIVRLVKLNKTNVILMKNMLQLILLIEVHMILVEKKCKQHTGNSI